MSQTVQRLQERRATVWAQAMEIADRASDENRALNADEESAWQKANGEIDALDSRIKNVLDGEKRAQDAEEAIAKIATKPKEVRTAADNTIGAELRAFLRGESGREFVVNGKADFRALSKLTAGAGGNTVPTSFYDRLIQHLIVNSGILQAGATVIQTDSGEPIPIPKTTSHPTATLVAETAVIPTSDPGFGQVTLNAYKYGDLTQVSRELLADSGVDLEGYLAERCGAAVGNALGAHLINGTGGGVQPLGVLAASGGATTGVTGGTGVGGAPTPDNLIDLFYSVIAPYRSSPQCGWLMNDATIATVRKIKDTTGQYLWQPSLQVGAPDLLLGKPVHTDPNVPTTATSAKSIVFGDWSKYFVRLAGGVRFERSDDFAFDRDMVTFRCLVRGDGALVDTTGALKTFVGAAS